MKEGDYIKILHPLGHSRLKIGDIYLVLKTNDGFHKLSDNNGKTYDWSCSCEKNRYWELSEQYETIPNSNNYEVY